MRWQLTEPHHIDEQVLPVGTIIGDDTQWLFRVTKADPRLNRKVGDPMPCSTAMIPMDDEARAAYDEKFQGKVPESDPTKSIPLTGDGNSPLVRGQGQAVPPIKPQALADAQREQQGQAPKTGMMAPGAIDGHPSGGSNQTPRPDQALADKLAEAKNKKPEGHDSSKNPGDSKDTETAKTPDVKKL